MVKIRSQNEIVLALLDFYRTAQPNLDTKPGSVSRDLLVDGFATQLSRLYEELSRVSTLQSLRLSIGNDLDRLASNFGTTRKRGSKSSGPALLTFSTLESDVAINKGDIVSARNGSSFVISNGVVVNSVFSNAYRAIASQNRADLDLLGITDEFAVEVLVEATASGTQGNISKYTLATTEIPGVSNITNISAFGGGRAAEDDATFRSRILAIFSGANTGTSLGYKNAVLEDPAVLDAVVITPGDPLMTRDGTQVFTENGESTIISEGSGGKVDVYVFGSRLQEVVDSFIYLDLSNTGTATSSKNDFILGQIDEDEGKTVTRKRLDNLETGVLPEQPVNNIVEIAGSLSGGNFIEKSVDSLGRVSGNYELVRDDGVYGGSPWGFDKIHWISDQISDLQEDKTKGIFNGQDALSFTDVLEIGSVQQNINVINENSRVVTSNRAFIQLSHYPVTNVTRVFNTTTGERYVVANQNPDGSGSINTTGRIQISGSSLPAVSDVLQTDYTWVISYDSNFDFDNRLTNKNPRSVQDSIDWGFSNAVRREQATLMLGTSVLTAETTHPISSIIDVNVFESETSEVILSSGRLSVVVANNVENVISIVRDSDGSELWNTSDLDGSFSFSTIFLPTDTVADLSDDVTVVYNSEDVYNVDGYEGNFNSNQVTIVPSSTAIAGSIVEINYIADINVLLPATLLSALPAVRNDNYFNTLSSDNIGSQPTTHIFSSPGVVSQNLRQAPSRMSLTIAGSISPGVITVSGTTIIGCTDIVYTIGTTGLKQDLRSAIRKKLGLNSGGTIPTNLKLARLISFEKVEATTNLEVLDTLFTYDIKGYALKDNSFVKDESIADTTLSVYEVRLPSTEDNDDNIPTVGDTVKITFYYILEETSENVLFSKSGTLYTNNVFAIVDTIAISSGFTSGSSASATLLITAQNQPLNGSRYKVSYDYTAPKSNERITIRYNYNKLLTDSTLNIESTRPINADVLAKEAVAIFVDVELSIVVTEEFINTSQIVQQNVRDIVTTALNATELGTIIDSSDLVNVAYSVDGVDRVKIVFFNESDQSGSVLSISAQKNEYIVANEVVINIETR